jgi:hypothetical protein
MEIAASAATVICALAPTFTDATAKAPVPSGLGIFTMPSPLGVAARAMMSGTGVVEPESWNVFTPEMNGAGGVLSQSKTT